LLLFDITLTKDVANTDAKTNVVVDGRVLVNDVPVTTLTLRKEVS